MKSFMRALVCAILCCCLISGCALAKSDEFSGYTDAQLLELLTRVQQEIADRRIEATANLKGGKYIAGKDLPAGKYTFNCSHKGDLWVSLTVYTDKEEDDLVTWKMITADKSPFEMVLTLEEGNVLECDGPFSLTVYAGVMFR